jgi:hypothetical protein
MKNAPSQSSILCPGIWNFICRSIMNSARGTVCKSATSTRFDDMKTWCYVPHVLCTLLCTTYVMYHLCCVSTVLCTNCVIHHLLCTTYVMYHLCYVPPVMYHLCYVPPVMYHLCYVPPMLCNLHTSAVHIKTANSCKKYTETQQIWWHSVTLAKL